MISVEDVGVRKRGRDRRRERGGAGEETIEGRGKGGNKEEM